MNSLKAVFFVLLYVLAMTRPIIPLASFVVNQDYIAEFFCINQDKPELECNGKCYLMQKLEEQNEKKRQNLPPIAMEEYPIGFVEFMGLEFSKTLISFVNNTFSYRDNYRFIFSKDNDHPPNSWV